MTIGDVDQSPTLSELISLGYQTFCIDAAVVAGELEDAAVMADALAASIRQLATDLDQRPLEEPS